MRIDVVSACDDAGVGNGWQQQALVGSPAAAAAAAAVELPHSDVDQQYQTPRGRNVSKYVTAVFVLESVR